MISLKELVEIQENVAKLSRELSEDRISSIHKYRNIVSGDLDDIYRVELLALEKHLKDLKSIESLLDKIKSSAVESALGLPTVPPKPTDEFN